MKNINKNSDVEHCADEDYYVLSDLSSILTELTIERSILLKTEDFVFSNLLNYAINNSITNLQSSENQFSSPESTDHDIWSHTNSGANENNSTSLESSTDHDSHKEIRSKCEHSNNLSSYNAPEFVRKLRSLIACSERFAINYKVKLMKSTCRCLFHYFLHKNKLHNTNQKCAYELLFPLIDHFETIDFSFCLYVISDLKLCDDLFDFLFELKSSTIDPIIELYFKQIKLHPRTNDKSIACTISSLIVELIVSPLQPFSDEQLFQLNITFAMSLIRMLFQSKNNPDLVCRYTDVLDKLIQSNKTSSVQIIDSNLVYELLRIYYFLIELFLNHLIESASKTAALQTKYTPGQKIPSFDFDPIKIEDQNLFKVFDVCYEMICSLLESQKINKKVLSDNLSSAESEPILNLQKDLKDVISVWRFVKRFLVDCVDIELILYRFLPETTNSKLCEDTESKFVYNYLDQQKHGHLFLAYCFITSQPIKIVEDVVTCLDPITFVHPKMCYLLAERAFIAQEHGKFLVDLLLKTVIDLKDKNTIQKYLEFHFKHFGFRKLAIIDLHDKRHIFNRADLKQTDQIKNEIIKLALIDPIQLMFHLLNYSILSNRALLVLVSEMLCKELKHICLSEVKIGRYNVNFFTALLNFKVKNFEYSEISMLAYFFKYFAFYVNTNHVGELIDYEKLIIVQMQYENFEKNGVVERKLFFLQTAIDLIEMFKIEYQLINKYRTPILVWCLQAVGKFWNVSKFKVFALNLLEFFKKDLRGKMDERDQMWLRSRMQNRNIGKQLWFYVSDLFDNQLYDEIDFKNLDQQLFLSAIDEKWHHTSAYLQKQRSENLLPTKCEQEILKFVTENRNMLTLKEHLNLFNLLIEFLKAFDLLSVYVKGAIDNLEAYPIEVLTYLVRQSMFKKSKLLDIIKVNDDQAHNDCVNQIELFYNYMEEVKFKVSSFYDMSKFENLILEVRRFIHQNRTSPKTKR